MAKNLAQLREERRTNALQYRNILDNNKGKLTPSEMKRLNELLTNITALEDKIEVGEKERDAQLDKLVSAKMHDTVGRIVGKYSTSRQLLAKWMKGGDSALSAQEWQQIRNTMSTTTNSQGGYAVAADVASEVFEALKSTGSVRSVATVIQTQGFGDLSYPNSNGTSEVGELIGQNVTATAADPSFGSAPISCFKFSSKIVTVPFELLSDSDIDFQSWLNARLATRLARITNQYFTTGSGSSQPYGVVTQAASGKVGTTGQTTSVIYADLVDLESSLDPAYRKNGVFMLNDSTLQAVKKLVDTAARPLWMPALSPDMPQSFLGYPVTVNSDMATMAANAKSILFGDFSRYVVRDVAEIDYHRMDDSAYIKLGQVGFLAYLRSGGNLCDVGGAVKYYQNSAT